MTNAQLVALVGAERMKEVFIDMLVDESEYSAF